MALVERDKKAALGTGHPSAVSKEAPPPSRSTNAWKLRHDDRDPLDDLLADMAQAEDRFGRVDDTEGRW